MGFDLVSYGIMACGVINQIAIVLSIYSKAMYINTIHLNVLMKVPPRYL